MPLREHLNKGLEHGRGVWRFAHRPLYGTIGAFWGRIGHRHLPDRWRERSTFRAVGNFFRASSGAAARIIWLISVRWRYGSEALRYPDKKSGQEQLGKTMEGGLNAVDFEGSLGVAQPRRASAGG